MSDNSSDIEQKQPLIDALAGIEGVESVTFDPQTRRVVLLLRSGVAPHRVDHTAREILGAEEIQILTGFRPEHRDRQRVRFVELHRAERPEQQIAYSVTLEWAGSEYTGEAIGAKGDALELRTVATAALAAVSAMTPGDLQIKLAGVKQVRAFDAEMVVVSMYRPEAEPHNLVGAVVAGDDPRRAAAAAVLSGLNRLLGNYLVT
ncbi:MAG: hypothetical protein WEF86_07010 [Gemmatimonadota bacterium]